MLHCSKRDWRKVSLVNISVNNMIKMCKHVELQVKPWLEMLAVRLVLSDWFVCYLCCTTYNTPQNTIQNRKEASGEELFQTFHLALTLTLDHFQNGTSSSVMMIVQHKGNVRQCEIAEYILYKPSQKEPLNERSSPHLLRSDSFHQIPSAQEERSRKSHAFLVNWLATENNTYW